MKKDEYEQTAAEMRAIQDKLYGNKDRNLLFERESVLHQRMIVKYPIKGSDACIEFDLSHIIHNPERVDRMRLELYQRDMRISLPWSTATQGEFVAAVKLRVLLAAWAVGDCDLPESGTEL